MKRIFIFCAFVLSCLTIHAQSPWRFYIAFEDSTTARDTIWLVWDTTATDTVDQALGEGAVTMNDTVFNVYIGNTHGDTTKVNALPFNLYSLQAPVHAMNYRYPITVTWDSALFHVALPQPVGYVNVASIDNDYFFNVNNGTMDHTFNMLIDDHALAPSFNWFSQSQFPMNFRISRDPFLWIENQNRLQRKIQIYPNPYSQKFSIVIDEQIKKLEIFSEEGKLCYQENLNIENQTRPIVCSLPDLAPGFYFVKITNSQNQPSYEKLIKSP